MLVFNGNKFPPEALQDFIEACADYEGLNYKKDMHEHNEYKHFPHNDGYGFSYFENNQNKFVTKHYIEPIFEKSEPLRDIAFRTSFLLIHARKASPGIVVNINNNHPFQINFLGTEWLFAHNGTIKSEINYDHKRFTARGTTDSERFFYAILTMIANNNKQFSKDKFEDILNNWEWTGANFILSDHRTIWVGEYYNEKPKYYTLKVYLLEEGKSIIVSSSFLPSIRKEPTIVINNREILRIDKKDNEIKFL